MSDAVALPPEQVVEEEPHVPTRRLLVFNIGGSSFACEMDSFREIVPMQHITRLPGAPHTVRGLINLRGTIVTVIDGGTSLGKQAHGRAEGLILLVDYFDRWIESALTMFAIFRMYRSINSGRRIRRKSRWREQ